MENDQSSISNMLLSYMKAIELQISFKHDILLDLYYVISLSANEKFDAFTANIHKLS